MAGIYIHIPFCKSRCIYCGFYSTTQAQLRQRYVDALCREMTLRYNYIKERARTLYIGGGTPSQLSATQLEQLFSSLGNTWPDCLHSEEITMECNPDDVTADFAALLGRLPVNRVSMGVQTFDDERLRFLHRRHTATQARQAVERLRQAGIANISIDLIYGFPGQTLPEWHRDVEQALQLDVEHLSAYALTYEEGTALHRMLQRRQVSEVDEETSRQMYYDMADRLLAAGYEHYELSNFARPGRRSLHNSNYWNHTPYLGLGAAAHSFDGHSRQWNVSHAEHYIEAIEQGQPDFERETLDANTLYNERIMTALRTSDGLSLDLLTAAQRRYCLQTAQRFLADGLLRLENDRLTMARRALFISDMIIAELMLV